VAGVDHEDRAAGAAEGERGGETGETAARHGHVDRGGVLVGRGLGLGEYWLGHAVTVRPSTPKVEMKQILPVPATVPERLDQRTHRATNGSTC
jgi:hypothetical protein